MTNPITPPPELVQQWLGTYFGTTVTGEVSGVELALATQAAQWGADQELEACCEWLEDIGPSGVQLWGDDLRTDRRPKPPSLKEQALELVNRSKSAMSVLTLSEVKTIRQALETLPND